MYGIRTSPAGDYLMVTLSGFWDAEEGRRFAEELRSVAPANAREPLLCLVDGREFHVQSQETLAILEDLRISLAGRMEWVIAFPSALLRRQTERISGGGEGHIFDNIGDAIACVTALAVERRRPER